MHVFLLCLLVSFAAAPVHATVVQIEARPGIPASASYFAGRGDKPAVLLLHGFLQTRAFVTVAALARGLNDAGYPVLSPTLSLGIPNRETSLACEAVHTHGMDDDVTEIASWVAWMKSQGHASIVLVGHSFGSLQLLAYLSGRPDPAVKAYFGTSLIEANIGDTPRADLLAQLERQVLENDRALVSRPLSFCRNYLSTSPALLSYARWDQARTLASLKQAPVKTRLVMGDSDEMLGRDWIQKLKRTRVPVTIVDGANHFMDGQHEFELLDHALQFLKQVPPQ